jgi:hypothetical protein
MIIALGLMMLLLGQVWLPATAGAQDPWTPEQQQVLAAIEQLSASTAPGGGGPVEYGAVLSEEFSRWTIGSEVINNKEDWVAGLKEWFDEGWRVSDRKSRDLDVFVGGDYAFTRRIVEETYLGPTGDTSVSSAALAEVWVSGDDGWRLLRVDVHPLPSD